MDFNYLKPSIEQKIGQESAGVQHSNARAALNSTKDGESVLVENSEGASFTVGIHPDGTRYANSNNEAARLLIERSLGLSWLADLEQCLAIALIQEDRPKRKKPRGFGGS